jgi:hypothetical protein
MYKLAAGHRSGRRLLLVGGTVRACHTIETMLCMLLRTGLVGKALPNSVVGQIPEPEVRTQHWCRGLDGDASAVSELFWIVGWGSDGVDMRYCDPLQGMTV